MGHLRKRSFLIFHDPEAPTHERTLASAEVAEIEAAHEAAKRGRITNLIKARLVRPADPADLGDKILQEMSYASSPSISDLFPRDADTLAKEKAAAEEREARRAEARKAAEEEDARLTREAETGESGKPWREIVRMVQDVIGYDEPALKEYLRTTFRSTGEMEQRTFAWDVFGVVTSRAELPDTRYRPSRSPETTVRFKDGRGRFGVNEVIRSVEWDEKAGEHVELSDSQALQNLKPTLWAKVADGAWEKDGNWGGHLQVTCATDNGKWIDSSNGWLWPQSSQGDKVTFYDMGAYYEIWQKDRDTGRPLVVEDDWLRFSDDRSQPGRFNIEDATWE